MNALPHMIHFVGIGGIGMSGLARYFHKRGVVVAGYDRTPGPVTDKLIAEGITVRFGDDPQDLPQGFREAPVDHLLVVRTPAVPEDSPLLRYWQQRGARILKRAEVLGLITADRPTIAVAGTHGKTTVTTLLTHLLHSGGVPVNGFLGGISANYGTNAVLDEHARLNVVEADEYDRSFLRLHPTDAIVTAMDPDHLEIYGTPGAMVEAYDRFVGLCTGHVLVHERLQAELPGRSLSTYGFGDATPNRAERVRVEQGAYRFDLVTEHGRVDDLRLGMPGRHNVENAVAAGTMALRHGLDPALLRDAMASFKGVERRFQTIVSGPSMLFIDDYAHHPAELEAVIRSVRELHPGRHITGIFQPHLYSRTRDLAEGFASSLALLDRLLLLEIYPARELPIAGITSGWLLEQVPLADKRLCRMDELIAVLRDRRPDVLLTLGAGDIDRCVAPIAQWMDQPHAA